uniref:Lathosterol oxidase n=1 Tax=Tetraselmis sp. GSL018 TaxID=582737 RepID=A0A061QZY9_9CHLO|mmetsp:Transcript_21482/g.51264  ORF Transcript_21482/g.51264 Transcript_21482/m.51264 type:complete len:353 (+) Transcript_21482:193-1251(+)
MLSSDIRKGVPQATRSHQLAFLSCLALCIFLVNHAALKPSGEGGTLDSEDIGLVHEVLYSAENDTMSGPDLTKLNLTAATGSVERLYRSAKLQLLREENEWKNSLILPRSTRSLPSFVQSWLRNFVCAVALYLGLGTLWAYYIYVVFGAELFGSKKPGFWDMLEQIKVSMAALPLYSMLPALSEWMVEQGWTKAYPRLGEYGLTIYALQFIVYIAGVELGVYWMHRSLHYGPLYKHLHYIHHKYNKEHTLSPFAGLAFHPLDGILQATPYVVMLFVVPFHALTHELLLFATAVWTTNIHDCLHGRCEPIMGAGYHTIHHTSYKENYGHYFVYMDWLFNSLELPPVGPSPKEE